MSMYARGTPAAAPPLLSRRPSPPASVTAALRAPTRRAAARRLSSPGPRHRRRREAGGRCGSVPTATRPLGGDAHCAPRREPLLRGDARRHARGAGRRRLAATHGAGPPAHCLRHAARALRRARAAGDRARVWRGGGGPGLRARAAPPPRQPRRALLLPLSRQAALERGGCRRAALHGRRAEARGALAVPAAVRPARGGDDGLREHRARQLALHRLGLRRRLSAAAGAAARAGPGRARGAPPVHRHRRRRGAAGVARRRAAGAAGLDQPLRGQEEPAARRGGAARAHPGAGRQEGGQRPPHARGGLGPAAARERRVLRGAAGPRPPCLPRNPFRPAPWTLHTTTSSRRWSQLPKAPARHHRRRSRRRGWRRA